MQIFNNFISPLQISNFISQIAKKTYLLSRSESSGRANKSKEKGSSLHVDSVYSMVIAVNNIYFRPSLSFPPALDAD